jgi:uncharacterized iron-regulated membrane protein
MSLVKVPLIFFGLAILFMGLLAWVMWRDEDNE